MFPFAYGLPPSMRIAILLGSCVIVYILHVPSLAAVYMVPGIVWGVVQ